MDEYISRDEVLTTIRYRVCQGQGNKEHMCKRGSCAYCGIMEIMSDISSIEAADVQQVKHGRWIDHEKLIGIFGTLCDHMVDNGRCDVFCPYADTKDKNDECEAWRTIQQIRQEVGNETD